LVASDVYVTFSAIARRKNQEGGRKRENLGVGEMGGPKEL